MDGFPINIQHWSTNWNCLKLDSSIKVNFRGHIQKAWTPAKMSRVRFDWISSFLSSPKWIEMGTATVIDRRQDRDDFSSSFQWGNFRCVSCLLEKSRSTAPFFVDQQKHRIFLENVAIFSRTGGKIWRSPAEATERWRAKVEDEVKYGK